MPTLQERVERLERANRRWKWLAAGLGAVALAAGAAAEKELVRANGVTVAAADGSTRLILRGEGKDGFGARLVVFDEAERPRLQVGTLDGEPFLQMSDTRGKVRFQVAMLADGSVSAVAWDRDGGQIAEFPPRPAPRPKRR